MELLRFLVLLTGLARLKSTAEGECSGSVFTCSNGQCVPHSWRCDHSRDCEDGSDEENCSQNECEVNNGGCSHVCLDLTLGFLCDCPPDMRLVQDTYCEEVDHCLDADVCDQMCVHSNGTLMCDCQDGYMKSSESGQCIATGDTERGVIFSSSAGICWMNSSDSVQKQLTNCTNTPGPLAAFSAQRTIFWSSPEHTGVYRLFLDDKSQTPAVLFEGYSGIVGLAVDWVYERLYWISTDTRALHVTALNGSEHSHAQLVISLNKPTAIAVQPLLGLLFWADSGASPRIERSSLDGGNRKALITSIIRNPASICLDITRGLLYWADSGLHTISRARYDGQHRKTVVESNGYLDEPFGLAVFEGRVYWTDRLTGSICSADKHSGKQLTVTQNEGTRFPAGLIIYHPLLQPKAGKVLSPASDAHVVSDSAFPWTLSLIGVLCILLVVLLLFWRRTDTSASSPLSNFDDPTLKESQDPLVPSTHTVTPNEVGIDVEL